MTLIFLILIVIGYPDAFLLRSFCHISPYPFYNNSRDEQIGLLTPTPATMYEVESCSVEFSAVIFKVNYYQFVCRLRKYPLLLDAVSNSIETIFFQ